MLMTQSKIPADLAGYMGRYGTVLTAQLMNRIEPLHVPGEHSVELPPFLRTLYSAQRHVVAAAVKQLNRDKSVWITAKMGTGKTLMGSSAVHAHANGTPYRAIVLCPPHLVYKWKRELELSIPDVRAMVVTNYRDVLPVTGKSTGAEWYILSENTAKMGVPWREAFTTSRLTGKLARCPDCNEVVMGCNRNGDVTEVPIDRKILSKSRQWCSNCGGALWTWDPLAKTDAKGPRRATLRTKGQDKWPVANYIRTQKRGMFDYLVIDEAHQEAKAGSARAVAMGTLAASVKKTIALTGTLIGGKADDVRCLLFRLSPTTVIEDGLGWHQATAFSDLYGRVETVVTESKELAPSDHKQSKGVTRTARRSIRPGIMPTLYGRHLLDKAIFLSLEELADGLPAYHETVHEVAMDREQATAYKEVEEALRSVVKTALASGDRRLLSTMLWTLLGYADHPYGWGEIGYYDTDEYGNKHWVHVVTPPDLSPDTIRPKEQAIIDFCKQQARDGRKTWLFVEMTVKKDVQPRLQTLLRQAGLKTKILRASMATTANREGWIQKNGPDVDVMISHPGLVETGLDFFDEGKSYNFPSIAWYQTGYQLTRLRQASARAWRIGQVADCRTAFFWYGGTMQANAMDLMGEKLEAAMAIEGQFSSDGLAALGEDGGSMEMALAKSLVSQVDRSQVKRRWERVSASGLPLSRGADTPSPPPQAKRMIQLALFPV